MSLDKLLKKYHEYENLRLEIQLLDDAITNLRQDRIQDSRTRLSQIPPIEAQKGRLELVLATITAEIKEMEIDPYELLGVETTSTKREIEQAYRAKQNLIDKQRIYWDDMTGSLRSTDKSRDFIHSLNQLCYYEDLDDRLPGAYSFTRDRAPRYRPFWKNLRIWIQEKLGPSHRVK